MAPITNQETFASLRFGTRLFFHVMTQPTYRFQLLAPSGIWPLAQNELTSSTELYNVHLASLQQLRGYAYLQDGAIQNSHLDARGGYRMNDDERCWHFLLVNPHEQAIACARYLVHGPGVTYDQLRIAQSPLARDPRWGIQLRQTVETTLQKTRREQVRYAELGGWAIAEEYRNTKAALEILLAFYLWAEMMGHCVCSCTAAVPNGSSSILRRVGAKSLLHEGEPLPAYFDAQYGCIMEVLGFDSRQAPPRFAPLLNEMRPKSAQSPIYQLSREEAPILCAPPPSSRSPFQLDELSMQSQPGQTDPQNRVSG